MAKKIFFIACKINNVYGFAICLGRQENIVDMGKSKELFEKKQLENNLELIIFQHYKHTAGDRCQVTFEALIEVAIKEEYFKSLEPGYPDFNKVTAILGDKTSYRYSKVRNFISENDKDKVFEDLKRQFLDNNLKYISSPSFPVKLIKRNFVIAEKEEIIKKRREAFLKNS